MNVKNIIYIFCAGIILFIAISPLFADLRYERVHTSIGGAKNILIFVNTHIYEPILPSLNQYIMDLESEGYNVTAIRFAEGSPAELRDYIKSFTDLNGVIFIGDLPVARFEIENDFDYYGYAEFPIDLFYMDLNGEWLDSNGNGIYDIHNAGTGNLDPEIWLGRLTVSTISHPMMDEVGLLINYFTKNHNYRKGSLPIIHRALAYSDDTWAYSDKCSMDTVYPDVTVINDGRITTAADYKERLRDNYEWVHVTAHSSPTTHFFYELDTRRWGAVTYSDIRDINPSVLFYNLCACSNCRYTTLNYMGGNYIFAETYGLFAVGSTKTGSMIWYHDFYSRMGPSIRANIGESYIYWLKTNDLRRADYKSWFYGLTLLGDPTLSIDPPIASIDSVSSSLIVNGESVTFTGSGRIRYGEIVNYSWRSSINGYLGDSRAISTDTLSTGTHTIYLKVQDNKGRWSIEDKRTLIVRSATNHPPVLTSIDDKSVNEGAVLSFTVTATDPDGDALAYSTSALPGGAAFSERVFTWVPNYSQAGIYSVTFTVSDGELTDSETITIIVNNTLTSPLNLALECRVSASSYYNNNYRPGLAVDGKCGIWDGNEWASRGEMTPWISFRWDRPQYINKVVLYDRSNPIDHIRDAWLYLNKGGRRVQSIHLGMFPYGGSAKEVVFDAVEVDEVRLVVTDGVGLNIGLSEIMIFDDPDIPDMNNLALGCRVSVSSYYNNNYRSELAVDGKYGIWDGYEWASRGEMTPWISFRWDRPQYINKFVLYDRSNPIDHIRDAWLYLNKGGRRVKSIHLGMFPYGGSAKEVVFDRTEVDEVMLVVIDGVGLNIGLSEIMIFDDPDTPDMNNLALGCRVSASSYYDDNYRPELAVDGKYGIWDGYEWASRGQMRPWINLRLGSPQYINKVVLYDRSNPIDHIRDGWLYLYKGGRRVKSIHLGMFAYGGSAKEVVFDEVEVDEVMLAVIDGVGMNIGLSEIMAYSE